MENNRQKDQTDQEEKGQPLNRSDSFHNRRNNVTFPVSRARHLFNDHRMLEMNPTSVLSKSFILEDGIKIKDYFSLQ